MTQTWIQGNCARGGMDQRGLVDHPAVGTAFFIATWLCSSVPGPVFDLGSSGGQAEGPDSNVAGEKQIVTFHYDFSSA